MKTTLLNKSRTSPFFILAILVLTAVAAPLSQNKVSPIAPALMQQFGIGEVQLGMLISVFSFTGIILSLPGGLLIHKFGPWKCVLASMLALLAGSLLGTYSGSFEVLLVSRVIEGIGMGLVAIAGPSIVGATVDQKSRGLAMGFFSAYIGVGQVLTYNLAPQILKQSSWKGVWWFSNIYTIVFTLVWIFLMLRLKVFFGKNVTIEKKDNSNNNSIFFVFKNKSLWYLTISMCFYVLSYPTLQAFLPSYLSTQRGMEMSAASSLVSICCLVGTASSLLAGIVSDKLRSRRMLGGIALIVSGGLFALIPFVPTSLFILIIFIIGAIPPFLPVCVFAATSEVIDDSAQSGMAMGMVSLGQNIGFVIGPVIFGALTQQFSWHTAIFFTVPLSIFGGIIMLVNRKVR